MEKVVEKVPYFKFKRFFIGILVVSVASTLLFWKLGNLTKGFAPQEIVFLQQSSSIHSIINNPINAPQKLLQFGILKAGFTSTFAMRVVSVLFAALLLLTFFYWIKSWTTRRMATLSTILLICSSWFLNNARVATPQMLQSFLLTLAFYFVVFQAKSKKNKTKILLATLILSLSIYVPGLIWLLIPVILWRGKSIITKLRRASLTLTILSVFILIVLVAPLIISFLNNPSLIRDYIGLPTIAITPLQWLKNFASTPISVLFYTNQPAYVWLNSTALLDIFCAAMAIIGSIRLSYFYKSRRSILVFGSIIILAIAIGFGGLVRISIIMPLVYLLIAKGMVLILQQWFTVFPKNPFARTLGATIITSSVLIASFYGVYKYFVAWPNSPNTKVAFSSRQNY